MGEKKKKSESGDFFSPPGFVRFELTSPFFFPYRNSLGILFSFFLIAHILLIDFSFRCFFFDFKSSILSCLDSLR